MVVVRKLHIQSGLLWDLNPQHSFIRWCSTNWAKELSQQTWLIGVRERVAYQPCLLAGLFSSVSIEHQHIKLSVMGSGSTGVHFFFHFLSIMHDMAVTSPLSCTNQAGLGLIAPDFLSHFVYWGLLPTAPYVIAMRIYTALNQSTHERPPHMEWWLHNHVGKQKNCSCVPVYATLHALLACHQSYTHHVSLLANTSYVTLAKIDFDLMSQHSYEYHHQGMEKGWR